MEIKEWIKNAREHAEMNQEALGEALARTKGNVSGWENGLHEPSFSQIVRISQVTRYSLAPLLPPPQPTPREAIDPRQIHHTMSSLTPEQMSLLYEKLSPAKRRELTGLMVAAGLVPGLSVEVIGQWKEMAIQDSGSPKRGTRHAAATKPQSKQESGGQ